MTFIKFQNFVIVTIFICIKDVACSAKCEQRQACHNGTVFCYGGSTGLTADDALCIINNKCDQSLRLDTCTKCDDKQYKNNSRYQDCTGRCYEKEKMGEMKTVDMCGVCDGKNNTCSPSVTGLDVTIIPDTANFTFNITGKSLITKDIQIVLLKIAEPVTRKKKREAPNEEEYQEADTDASADHGIVKRAADKVVKHVLEVVKVHKETLLEVRVDGIEPGKYEIGARTGDDGKEYEEHKGPTLIVYDESGNTVDRISPTEQDLDGTEKATVTLKLTSTSAVATFLTNAKQLKCYYSNSTDASLASETQSSATGAYSNNKLECEIDIPDASKAIWVCPSFNMIHLLNCKRIAFFELAPTPVEKKLIFLESGLGLYIDFDKAVENEVKTPCSAYFTNTSTFGQKPKCYFNDTGERFHVLFGERSTANPGDTLELMAGLITRDAEFTRQSEALTVTLATVSGDAVNPIKIAKVGSWPEKLTAVAESPIILTIEIVELPGGRPQKSITWSVNGETKDAAKDQFDLILDVTNAREYVIIVTAEDFLGGTDKIEHIIEKKDVNLPNVLFSSSGIMQGVASRFVIHPNTIVTISASLTYPEGTTLNNYDFQWQRNGEDVPGELKYTSATNETTIDMCGDEVLISLKVSSASNQQNSITFSIKVNVKCRDPIAKIAGNTLINVDVKSDDIKLYGSSSRDLDGGALTYNWTCSTIGNTECIDDVTGSADTSMSLIVISPSKLKTDKRYAIFLTVSANKSGEVYSKTARVEIAVHPSNRPVIRWVAMRTKFRHDVPIMLRAHVGNDVTVKWKFRDDLSLYEYIDARNKSIGKYKKTDDGFAWYRIHQDVLEPGKQYKLQINVTKTGTKYFSTDEHEIYVYKNLRGCTIKTGQLTEFEEATIILRNCVQDPDVIWKSIMCFEGDKELQISKDHTFIVPRFKPTVEKIVLKCKIKDNLGHTMQAEPREIVVRKASAEKTMDQMVDGFKQTGDKVKALALISEMSDGEDDDDVVSLNPKAVELIKEIVNSNPTNDDINWSLKSYGRLKVDKMEANDKIVLADHLVSMLDKLCRTNDHETDAVMFDAEQTKHILRKTKHLMESHPEKLGKLYRKAEEKMACIKFKRMKNEDFEIITDEDGTKHAYLVSVLEDIPEDLGLKFPEELKEKYRDDWKCKETDSCFGVAIKLEDHPEEPPDFLKFKRAKNGCNKYLILTIYNPESGEPIDVYNLEGTIDLNLGSGCKRGKCWYRDEALHRFSQDGVTTIVAENGEVHCHTKHLTAFTAEKEPELYSGWNFPYIISLCVGAILLLISLVVIVKLWLVTKHRAIAVEDEKHFALEEVPMSKADSPFQRKRSF